MRVAALIIGILAGLAGLIGGGCALAIGGVGEAFGAEGAEEIVGLGWLALAAGVGGLVGAGMSMAKPKIASALMAIAGVVGLIAVSFAFLFATVLFGVAALLAFLGRNEKKADA